MKQLICFALTATLAAACSPNASTSSVKDDTAASASLSAAPSTAQSANLNLKDSDNNGSYAVTQGGKIIVKLADPGDSGAKWNFIDAGALGAPVATHEAPPPPPPHVFVVGNFGTNVFTWDTTNVDAGTYQIQLLSQRPFGSDPGRPYSVTVTVSAAGSDTSTAPTRALEDDAATALDNLLLTVAFGGKDASGVAHYAAQKIACTAVTTNPMQYKCIFTKANGGTAGLAFIEELLGRGPDQDSIDMSNTLKQSEKAFTQAIVAMGAKSDFDPAHPSVGSRTYTIYNATCTRESDDAQPSCGLSLTP